ncbi:MAG: hypothetical protein K1X89_01585 [Myxococcaceae bacterium]|nr:hypothetical protein [Myxococcaceae bacterium]
MVPLVLTLLLAQPANPYLEEARALMKRLAFAEAIAQLKVAKQVPGQSAAAQAEVLWLLGRCDVAEGKREDAQAAFLELLELAPAYEADRSQSPKILEVFDEVKRKRYPKGYVKLELLPGPPDRLVVRLVDPWLSVAALVSRQRIHGEGDYREVPVALEGTQAVISLSVGSGQTLEHLVEARGDDHAVLATLGQEETPLLLVGPAVVAAASPYPEVEEASRLERAPAWLLVGAGVVALAVGAGLEARSVQRVAALNDRTQPPGDFADTARAEHAAASREAGAALGCFIGAGVLGAAGGLAFAW